MIRRIVMLAGVLAFGGWSHLAAQDSVWSRLTHRPNCPPTESCPWRPGLLWDTTNAMPRYPAVLKAVGVGGHVVVEITVDATGRVDSAAIRTEGSTQRGFHAPALAAVKTWRFGFSEAPGRPAAPIPMTFHLIFAIDEGCPGSDKTSYAWASRGAAPELIVLTCPGKLVPRDQVRPMNGPG